MNKRLRLILVLTIGAGMLGCWIGSHSGFGKTSMGALPDTLWSHSDRANFPLILLETASESLTLRNTGDTKLTACMVGVDKPSDRGGPSCRDCDPAHDLPGGMNHTMLQDSGLSGGDWLEVNTRNIESLGPHESLNIPLSTFRAYREMTLFAGVSVPWAYVVCRDATSQDRRVTVSF